VLPGWSYGEDGRIDEPSSVGIGERNRYRKLRDYGMAPVNESAVEGWR